MCLGEREREREREGEREGLQIFALQFASKTMIFNLVKIICSDKTKFNSKVCQCENQILT